MKAKKEDWSLRGKQITFMIYDHFRVTGAHGPVLDYPDLFSVTLHDDTVQECRNKMGRSSPIYVKDFLQMISWKDCTN